MEQRDALYGGRRGYHHGHLKEALVEAARVLVAERGPSGFTLAEAAKRVGVTAAAPYRHFTDRDALMDELARRGFDQFAGALGRAWEGGRPDPVTAVRRMGFAYLGFASDEPGLYSAMFGTAARAEPGRVAAGGRALDALMGAMREVLAHLGAPGADARRLALEVWAMSHGIAMLSLARQFEGVCSPDEPAALLDAACRSLIEAAVRGGRPSGPWGRV